MENKISIKIIVPVLLSFFAMSFCDMVGIGVDRVKIDFNLSNTLASLIPSVAFLWFFILSVPVGVLQDRIGKKNMLNIGIMVTALGLFIPFLFYSFTVVLIGFALLGIGNTIIQVSANPLLLDVVPKEKGASFMSLSQFIKSIGSMIAAPLAGWFAAKYGDWKILFLVFGVVSLLTALWLQTIKVEETKNDEKRASFVSSFKLLGNGFVAFMVFGIFLVVGIDVGVNSISGQFLLEKFSSQQALAESGRSIYFFGKMLGTFLGAIMLIKFNTNKFFIWSSVLALLAILALFFVPKEAMALVIIFVIGLGIANIFPLIFTITVGKYPNQSNEISGLMMMAISGGAVIPLIMGWISDRLNVGYSLSVLLIAIVFVFLMSIKGIKDEKKY